MHTNPIDSVDIDDLLNEAIENLAQARMKEEEDQKRSDEKIHLLESVVIKLEHIKRRREDSGILKKT
jgi:hypothetical protein